MGKKVKTGKSRRDKFYHLAKESGYRARSAFKLLQLNRKYEFLQRARVCVDLCAAPGGWLQVAAQNMPVSSLIIGVDLVPIKPIPGTTTLQEDITTEKCHQQLKKELQSWDVDVFLNDGAPNVGKTWVHDAYQQAELTLAALKLAVGFLKKGGVFVTKLFRSRDYTSLMWVFGQLFKKVYATKPQASRNESAEIFVVCQHYLKPDKLDPKFLDPRYVFKDVETSGPKKALDLMKPKDKKKPEGYPDNDYTLHHQVKVSDLLAAENHMELLADTNEVILDDEVIANHELTTNEIKECLKDIKVLGKKELRTILNWRRKLKKIMEEDKEKEVDEEDVEEMDKDSDEELEEKIATLKEQEEKEEKRKRKKVMKEKRKLRDKMALKMIIPGDTMEVSQDMELFKLGKIKKKNQIEELQKEDLPEVSSEDESDDGMPRKHQVHYSRHEDRSYLDEDSDMENNGSDIEMEEYINDDQKEVEEGEEEDGSEEEDGNPLVVELEPQDVIAQRQTEMWFNKPLFGEFGEDDDEDIEIEKSAQEYASKGGVVLGKNKRKQKMQHSDGEESDSGNSSDMDSDDSSNSESSDQDSDYDIHNVMKKTQRASMRGSSSSRQSKDGFEIVAAEEPVKKVLKLDPVGLAIGEDLIKSSKRRRELVEESFNRYTFNDEGLPDWFVKDERRHMRRALPVSQEQIDSYKEKLKAINARPIKKIAEAKARKKKKALRKLEKARKKSEVVTDAVDVSEKEKWQQIKQIYKKAGLLKNKKPEVTYVVAKRGAGRRVSRPAGVKGRFKVVDPRMKKDMRNAKIHEKGKNKKTGAGKNRKSAQGKSK